MSYLSIKAKFANRSNYVREIQENPRWSRYASIVRDFRIYLEQTENLRFHIHGERVGEHGMPEDIYHEMKYIHRWTDTYRRRVLAKFYALERWMKDNPHPVTMITLTTYQDGEYSKEQTGHYVTIEESFDLLKRGWEHLRQNLKEYPYVWIMEPHKTGYPHLHVVVFGEISDDKKRKLAKLWEKYGVGSEEHGANFETKKPSESIRSIRNYLMKYMVKGFIKTGSKFQEKEEWTTAELVFNALVKENAWRLFGASKELTTVMKYAKETIETIKYYATQLSNATGAKHLVWLLKEKTGWKDHERIFREPPKANHIEDRDLVIHRTSDDGSGIHNMGSLCIH